jgi:DNA polymerase-3 subunit epsilon
MIVFDTETTGLIQHPSTPLERQPEVIELCAVKLDDESLVEVGRIDFLIKPRILPLPDVITKITKLTEADVAGQPTFARRLPDIARFFRGEETAVAHNCAFDMGMLLLELRRLQWEYRFPWPSAQLCTVELTKHVKGHRLKLGELHELLTGEPLLEAHRARNDVQGLIRCVKVLRQQEVL